MNFDQWFEKQSLAVKIILIILPLVGWVMEILIRISAYTRSKNNMDLVLLIVFLLLGWTWIPLIIDVIYLAKKGHIFLAGDLDDISKESESSNKETVEAQPKEEEREEDK